MIIKLKIDEKERTFTTPFISGRRLRQTMDMSTKLEKMKQSPETLDMMVDYIVTLFNKQFTRDQFYDGIESTKVISTFSDCIKGIMGTLITKSKDLEVSQGKNE